MFVNNGLGMCVYIEQRSKVLHSVLIYHLIYSFRRDGRPTNTVWKTQRALLNYRIRMGVNVGIHYVVTCIVFY